MKIPALPAIELNSIVINYLLFSLPSPDLIYTYQEELCQSGIELV
jgi:hypothetical protein